MVDNDIKNLVALMRELGIAAFELLINGDPVRLELGPPPAPPVVGPIAPDTQAIGADSGYPTEEELLFASSPYPVTRDELHSKGGE